MSPQWLIAENNVPGRPMLLKKVIEVQGGPTGVVTHVDTSGALILAKGGVSQVAVFPFNYRVIQDEA